MQSHPHDVQAGSIEIDALSAISAGNISVNTDIFALLDSEKGESFCLLSLSPTYTTTDNTDLLHCEPC